MADGRGQVLRRAVARRHITAGQQPVSACERSRQHVLAIRLSVTRLFPMTSHVECVALLVNSDSGLR
jgi:hypothetical protein